MHNYSHRQPGTTTRAVLAGSATFVALVFGAVAWAGPPSTGRELLWPLLLVVVIFASVGWLFGSLTVAINEANIAIRFGPGWPRRTIALSDVRGATAVRNPWWYGWGIRLTPHGWLWNVSGFKAVELELANGRRTRIGTDQPQELTVAIRAAAGI